VTSPTDLNGVYISPCNWMLFCSLLRLDLQICDPSNVMSMFSKLICDLNCVAKFFPNLCVFQDLDLDSGKKIGNVKMCSRLYLLKNDTPQRKQVHNTLCIPSKGESALNSHVNKDSDVMLWHYCFGHRNLCTLKNYFLPYLSLKIQSFSVVKSINS
jgi:hypothetical protein